MNETETKTPDELMAQFEEATMGLSDLSASDAVWGIIEDILDSVRLATTTLDEALGFDPADEDSVTSQVYHCVSDYVTNHYGDL